MSTKKTEKSGDEKHEEPQGGRVHTIAKPRPTPATRKPTAIPEQPPIAVIVSDDKPVETAKALAKISKKVKTPATDTTMAQPDDGAETVVFAFRLSRSERDELHAATGSARASRFVRAIVLAGARGDMKAIEELIGEVNAGRR